MKKLLNNYEIHMQNFVKQMVQSPIKINNYKFNSMTTRQELFANTSNKILDKKGFSFKYFKTDKERIKTYIEKNEMENLNNKKTVNFKLNLKKNFLNTSYNNNKNKEDLEKIINIINHKDELNEEDKLLYKQLQYNEITNNRIILHNIKMDDEDNKNNDKKKNNRFYSKEDMLNIINNNSLTEEDKYKKLLHNKIYNETKNMLLFKKLKLIYSNKIKNFNKTNSNFFSKTHFNALENLSLFKSPTIQHNINKSLSFNKINTKKNTNNNTKNHKRKFYKTSSDLSETMPNDNNFRKYSIDINLENIKNVNNNNNKGDDRLFSHKNILDDISLRKEIVGKNPLLFQYHINYMKNINNKDNKEFYLNDKIIALKKMAFEKSENYFDFLSNIKYEESFYEMLRQNTEEILIDGQKFKKSDMDKIADKLLKNCNIKPKINFGK